MVTMLDVALKAGVSKSTVSRVLNGKNIVREDVKQRVLAAIDEIGYRPNLLARQLATSKTYLMGFVMTNALYNGSYFSTIVYNIASSSEKHDHQLILADGKHSAEDERKAINFLLDMKCSGIIVYPQYLSVQELEEIISNNTTPIIVINRYLPNYVEQFVTADHVQSSEILINFVLEQGHREIAYIHGMKDSFSDHYRYAAYKNGLARLNIPLNEQLVVFGDWSSISGYTATKELLARNIKFTALVAGNDDMAFGAIKALKEAGYRLPEDISIAGFDNTMMCEYTLPQLTSVNFPFDEIIEQAIMRIINPELAHKENEIKGKLIVRDSVIKLNVSN